MSTRPPRPILPPQPRELFWIDVRDHLPDDQITVLVALQFGEMELAWHEEGHWWLCASGGMEDRISHWMDLPEPPIIRPSARGASRTPALPEFQPNSYPTELDATDSVVLVRRVIPAPNHPEKPTK